MTEGVLKFTMTDIEDGVHYIGSIVVHSNEIVMHKTILGLGEPVEFERRWVYSSDEERDVLIEMAKNRLMC